MARQIGMYGSEEKARMPLYFCAWILFTFVLMNLEALAIRVLFLIQILDSWSLSNIAAFRVVTPKD